MSAGMSPKSKKFSVFNQILHEINRGYLGLISTGTEKDFVIQNLQQHQSNQIKSLTKYSISFFALAALLNNTKNLTVNGIPGFFSNIEIPIYYCQLVASSVFFLIIINLNLAIVTLVSKELIVAEKNNLNRYRTARSFLLGDIHSDISSPFRVGNLYYSRKSEFIPIFTLYILAFAAPLLGIIASTIIVFRSIAISIHNAGNFSVELLIPLTAMATIIAAICYMTLFFTPISIKKDTRAIRWLFLYPLLKDSNGLHQQAKNW